MPYLGNINLAMAHSPAVELNKAKIKQMKQEILTFFYGSYINLNVLKEVNYIPRKIEVATLNGFDLTIEPLANIKESAKGIVYGILATGTHEDLERLYSHAENILGGIYLPRAVLVKKISGEYVPALTYISSTMVRKKAEEDYVERIAKPAEKLDFPKWYIEKIRSFKH